MVLSRSPAPLDRSRLPISSSRRQMFHPPRTSTSSLTFEFRNPPKPSPPLRAREARLFHPRQAARGAPGRPSARPSNSLQPASPQGGDSPTPPAPASSSDDPPAPHTSL